jgi:putative copper resistance protein D
VTPDSGLVLARFVALAAMLAMTGAPFYCLVAGQPLLGRQMRKMLALLAVVAALASLWWALASVAAMAGLAMRALDRATVVAVLEATPLGTVLALRLAALVVLLAFLANSARSLPAALIGFAALASTAWTGHSGAAEGGIGLAQRALDAMHLGAASLWLGALLSFLASLRGTTDRTRLVGRLSAFARTGTLVVVTLTVTGSVNAWLIARPGWSPGNGWTLLLVAKLALFAAMLGLAAINRWRLTPALAADALGAERRLTVSLSFEAAFALAIVALVAVLGLLDPAGS